MSQRCPSCGMDSADDAAWCDFCKEPFRKKRKPAPAAPAPPAEAPVAAAPVPAAAPGEQLSEEELLKRLPSEFLKGDDGLALPKLPPWFKWLAWAFLASWSIAGMIVLGVLYGRKKTAAAPIPSAAGANPGNYDSGVLVVPAR